MAGRHAHSDSKAGVSPVLLVLVLVAVVAGAGWLVLRPRDGDTAAANQCDSEPPVVLSVVPHMEAVVEQALDALRAEEVCFPAETRVESPKDVEASFFSGAEEVKTDAAEKAVEPIAEGQLAYKAPGLLK